METGGHISKKAVFDIAQAHIGRSPTIIEIDLKLSTIYKRTEVFKTIKVFVYLFSYNIAKLTLNWNFGLPVCN